jgi:NAD(P)-dependent dehydrogenase (short-subunit alcohol dehydrogenase family)
LKHRKIRVNAVSPGSIATPGFSSRDMGPSEEQFKTIVVNAVPLGRMGNPEEVARKAYCPFGP